MAMAYVSPSGMSESDLVARIKRTEWFNKNYLWCAAAVVVAVVLSFWALS